MPSGGRRVDTDKERNGSAATFDDRAGAFHHVILRGLMAACGLLAATGFLTHGDRSNWVPAFFLVGALQEVRKLLRPCARLGDDGITYAEEWFTRRVGFADVVSWAHYREGAVMLFTTHDGRSWGLNLGEVARADRARALAHLTARLPPATILESVGPDARCFWLAPRCCRNRVVRGPSAGDDAADRRGEHVARPCEVHFVAGPSSDRIRERIDVRSAHRGVVHFDAGRDRDHNR